MYSHYSVTSFHCFSMSQMHLTVRRETNEISLGQLTVLTVDDELKARGNSGEVNS